MGLSNASGLHPSLARRKRTVSLRPVDDGCDMLGLGSAGSAASSTSRPVRHATTKPSRRCKSCESKPRPASKSSYGWLAAPMTHDMHPDLNKQDIL